MKNLLTGLLLLASTTVPAQQETIIRIHPEQGTTVIDKNIYGQFAEHLGTCIYGGLWVGEDSQIPNINGYRTDVLNALKDLKVPILRRAVALPMNITGWTASARRQTVRRW